MIITFCYIQAEYGIRVAHERIEFRRVLFRSIAKPRHCLFFGIEHSADIRAAAIALDADGSRFTLCLPGSSLPIRLCLPGCHNVMNALAAAAMAHAAGVPAAAIAAGLSAARGVGSRQQVRVLGEAVRLIDDSYNANPASVAAAIEPLASGPGQARLENGRTSSRERGGQYVCISVDDVCLKKKTTYQ